jgi:hypothetical protein
MLNRFLELGLRIKFWKKRRKIEKQSASGMFCWICPFNVYLCCFVGLLPPLPQVPARPTLNQTPIRIRTLILTLLARAPTLIPTRVQVQAEVPGDVNVHVEHGVQAPMYPKAKAELDQLRPIVVTVDKTWLV